MQHKRAVRGEYKDKGQHDADSLSTQFLIAMQPLLPLKHQLPFDAQLPSPMVSLTANLI